MYSWGVGTTGALGLGPSLTSVNNPTSIEALRPYTIIKVAAGEHSSVFVTKNGLVLTCGSATSGCLAVSHQVDLFEPKLVSCLLQKSIFDVTCGRNHVVVVASDGSALAWGSNEYGKLGIGVESSNCSFQAEPTPIVAPEGVKFKKAFAGADATALLDYTDAVWLAGNNRLNKLALNRTGHLLFGRGALCILCATTPQRARLPTKTPVISVSFGRAHTVFFLSDGKVVTAGGNDNGQLGLGHVKAVSSAVCARTHRHEVITGASAGSHFSLALTRSRLFFWGRRSVGRRKKRRKKRKGSSDSDETSFSSKMEGSAEDDESDDEESENPQVHFIIGKCNQSLMKLVTEHGPDCPIVKVTEPRLVVNKLSGLAEVLKDHHHSLMSDEEHGNRIILTPQPVLELFCARTLQTGELTFADVYSFDGDDGDSIFVVIESVVSCSSSSEPSIRLHIPTNEEKAIQKHSSKMNTTSLTVSDLSSRSETKHVRFTI